MRRSDERNWPTGTVTFLMTDVVDSSALAEQNPDRYLDLLARHDRIAHEIIASHGGQIVKHRGEGDSVFAAFGQAEPAACAAAELVRRAGDDLALKLRAALHCGAADLQEDDYRGDTVNRCGRLRSLAAPGQVLLSGSVAALLSGTQVLPLGPVQLRGLVRPIELFVLDAHGLNCNAPQDPAIRSGNISRPESPILGRTADLQALDLAFSRARTVQLVGPGGVGKTRLALEYGYRCGQGAWFVDLTLAETPPIEGTILHELGLAAPGERVPAAVVAESLANASLLVLDNCEHVPTDVVAFVKRVRRLAPQLQILLTTHQHLPIPGSATVPLRPLGTEGTDAAAIRLIRSIAEAKAVDLDGTEAEIAALCRDLDGLPLALELVVPRLRTLSVSAARTRLGRWLQREEGGHVKGRHTSLASLVTYSLGRLTLPERDLLFILVPFVGGFTLEHAEAIWGRHPDFVEEVLASLLEKSIISHSDVGAQRFRLLSSIREGARALAEREKAAESASRTFVSWGKSCALGALEVGAPYLTVRTELANLEAAFAEALVLDAVAEAAAIARAMRKMYLADSNVRSGRLLYEQLVPRAGALTDEDRADALNALGIFRLQQCDYAGAGSAITESQRLYEQLGNEARVRATLHNLAIVASDQGDLDLAISLSGQAVQGYASAGESEHELFARLTLAISLFALGNVHEAERAVDPIRQEAETSGDHDLLDSYLATCACHLVAAGRTREALDALDQVEGNGPDRDLCFALIAAGAVLAGSGWGARCAAVAAENMERSGLKPSTMERRLLQFASDAPVALQEVGVEDARALWRTVRQEIRTARATTNSGVSRHGATQSTAISTSV